MIDIKSRCFPYKGDCPICCDIGSVHKIEFDSQPYSSHIQIICPTCGIFKIGRDLYYPDQIKDNFYTYILSGVIREANDTFQTVIEIDENNFRNYLSESRKPATFTERLNKILLFINKKTDFARQYIPLKYRDYPICFAVDKDEFNYMIQILSKEGYIEFKNNYYENEEKWPDENYSPLRHIDDSLNEYKPVDFIEIRPTVNGWKKIDELSRVNIINSTQCFVAMWFTEEMNNIYQIGFEPGIRETGYIPQRIDKKEHNEKICDQIIAEIRQSRLVVADFTGHRGGVYFEAGFSMGLGKPLIWTCRKDHIEKCHFGYTTI